MPRHPYESLPDHTRWSRAVARVAPEAVDSAVRFPFRVRRADRVATAGSCFAQHIARHLGAAGFQVLFTEAGHPLVTADLQTEYGYGIYSARFGNIYTARQLLQLFRRAFGQAPPGPEPWPTAEGGWLDPLRPAIQPGGFASRREFEVDRRQHLAAVRRMFETLDVFVFTLGLTECWTDRATGTVYPVCPGVAGGTFDPEQTRFVNFSAAEVVADLRAFLAALRLVNPGSRVILTVSPVPLAATAIDRHVVVSTAYSKAVLRVACEEVCAGGDNVAYFPSFEVITSSATGGGQFAADRRSVAEHGVEHVMRLFLAHATEGGSMPVEAPAATADAFLPDMTRLVAVLCEEELLDRR